MTTTTAPTVDAGLFCRDLAAGGLAFPEVLAYWVVEGRPARMDADGNGVPCETVFSAEEIRSVLGFDEGALVSGLSCGEVTAQGFGYADALAYWVREGAPEQMDLDEDGIPCEDIYSQSDIDRVCPERGSITTLEKVNVWYHDWYGTDPAASFGFGTGIVDVGGVFASGGDVAEDCNPEQVVCEASATVFYVLDASGRAAWMGGTDIPGPTDALLQVYASAPKGLSCRDLVSPDMRVYPFSFGGSERAAFFWALVYWALDGKSSQMDADGDGVPCETVFPGEVVESVLAGGSIG